jgi:copper(I)-binding protein
MKKIFILLVVMIGITFSVMGIAGQHGKAMQVQGANGIEIHNPWVRAVPPASRTSAAYMVIKNTNDKDDILLSAETSIAITVELHNVRMKGKMKEMYQVQSIAIPAKGSAVLKRGAFHVMLIGLVQPLKAGDMVEITLHFKHAGSVKIKAPVKEGAGKMMHHGNK